MSLVSWSIFGARLPSTLFLHPHLQTPSFRSCPAIIERAQHLIYIDVLTRFSLPDMLCLQHYQKMLYYTQILRCFILPITSHHLGKNLWDTKVAREKKVGVEKRRPGLRKPQHRWCYLHLGVLKSLFWSLMFLLDALLTLPTLLPCVVSIDTSSTYSHLPEYHENTEEQLSQELNFASWNSRHQPMLIRTSTPYPHFVLN